MTALREIERRVLGSLVRGWTDALVLAPEDFGHGPHDVVYRACQAVHVSAGPITPEAVRHALYAQGEHLRLRYVASDPAAPFSGGDAAGRAERILCWLQRLPQGATRGDVVAVKRAALQRLLRRAWERAEGTIRRGQRLARENFEARWGDWIKGAT